jgi:hypothetical protein
METREGEVERGRNRGEIETGREGKTDGGWEREEGEGQ